MADIEDSIAATRTETLEDVQARHRKEVKELTAKTTTLKKSVGKGAGDKKKKKEITEQIALMEAELSKRHEQELAAAEQQTTESLAQEEGPEQPEAEDASAALEDLSISSSPAPQQGGKKKPNRQKLRKERKAQQFEEMRRQAEEEAANTENTKEIEDAAIAKLIEPLALSIKQIPPDGHCLYNAVAHQLSLHDQSDSKSYKELRHIAAEYMRKNPDDFMPFLVNNQGDCYNDAEYKQYCNTVEETALWGGQLEIQALSKALGRPIHIVQMGSPVLKVGEDLAGQPLTVS
ncbi:OTU domain-containing protein 6B [Rhizophlyctis rosea]|uniref:OTU domain-containing protein 6B n=1 Tax=Rhizophlyctis rosea TaxID=64517 RepID=A0AAD5X8J8_9FUNG|nr:OTU domain-containing protein 6B [Rhizophlyctis rosea]